MVLTHDYGVPALSASIPPPLQDALRAAASLVRYSNGQVVHQRGDTHAGLALIRSGAVSMSTVDRQGKTLVTAVLGPGQVFGEFTVFANRARTHTATACGNDTAIDHIGKMRLLALMEEAPALHRFFLTSLTERLHAMIEFAEDLRRLPLPVHTAKQVAQMAQWSTGASRIRITQTGLAQILGISRVAMGTALKALVSAGLIRTGYGHIEIPDGRALRAWLEKHGALG